MDVIYYDKEVIESLLGTAVSFPDVLSGADVLVLACSYQRGASPVIDCSAINRMKQGSYLINPARRALADHDSVLQAVMSRKLAGYAVDDSVFTKAQLAGVERGRIFQTHHTAWYSNEAMERGTQGWVDNLVALAKNKFPNRIV